MPCRSGRKKTVDCGDWSPDVDSVARPTAQLASEACEGKGSGPLRRIAVFVGHENVVGLLAFLGCQLE